MEGMCTIYTELLKKPDTFYLLLTRKKQIIDLSLYAYFSNKTLESILRKNIFINYRKWRYDFKNTFFITFASVVYV